MNAHASPIDLADTSLGATLALLAPHDDKALILDYGERRVQAGYHVTEVKAGSFVTLDCGGNPDAWQETILQVEDIAGKPDQSYLQVGKFRAILAQVDRKIRLNAEARLTIEISRPDEAMQVYDVAGIGFTENAAIIRLGLRPAICKPRHRAAQAEAAAACCAPGTSAASCC